MLSVPRLVTIPQLPWVLIGPFWRNTLLFQEAPHPGRSPCSHWLKVRQTVYQLQRLYPCLVLSPCTVLLLPSPFPKRTSPVNHSHKNPLLKDSDSREFKAEGRLNDKPVAYCPAWLKHSPKVAIITLLGIYLETSTIPGMLRGSVSYTRWGYTKSCLAFYASDPNTLNIISTEASALLHSQPSP